MFCEVELLRDVVVLAENLDRNGHISQRPTTLYYRLTKKISQGVNLPNKWYQS
jgi:hypothetical protein